MKNKKQTNKMSHGAQNWEPQVRKIASAASAVQAKLRDEWQRFNATRQRFDEHMKAVAQSAEQPELFV